MIALYNNHNLYKMKRKSKIMRKFIVVLSLVFIVFILGCTNIPFNPFQNKAPESTGTGLKLYFGDNAPPRDKIFVGENSRFIVTVFADNWGSAEISDATLKLWDNIPGTEALDIDDISLTIEGADVFLNSLGQETRRAPNLKQLLYSNPVSYNKDNIAEGSQLNIFAELLFNYRVRLQGRMCLSAEEDPTCPATEIISSSQLGRDAQHVPVTIDRIQKTATPLNENEYFVDLEITFRNSGGGFIDDDDGKELLRINDGFIKLGDLPFDCSPGTISFADSSTATVNCFISSISPGQTSQVFPLNIEYDVPYRMRIQIGPIPLVKVNNDE